MNRDVMSPPGGSRYAVHHRHEVLLRQLHLQALHAHDPAEEPTEQGWHENEYQRHEPYPRRERSADGSSSDLTTGTRCCCANSTCRRCTHMIQLKSRPNRTGTNTNTSGMSLTQDGKGVLTGALPISPPARGAAAPTPPAGVART